MAPKSVIFRRHDHLVSVLFGQPFLQHYIFNVFVSCTYMLIGPRENAVNWSMVGSKGIPNPDTPTMELDLSQFSPHLQKSIVIQVFGCALGFENEQQRLDFWDVIEDHLDIEQMKKDKGEFDFNHILCRTYIPWEYSVNYLTEYDPQSIMHCR